MVQEGGEGKLRLLSAGPIIQTVGGYPFNIFGGGDKIGIQVISATEAGKVVTDLVAGGGNRNQNGTGAGGETGAPWMQPHDGPVPGTPWPILSQDIANAIVAKAHALGKRVLVHAGENTGFERVLNAGGGR